MAKNLLKLTIVIALVACTETPVAEPPPYREPSGFMFVAQPEIKIHQRPEESSPVVDTWRTGQPVTLLATSGEWSEVRLGVGTGWVRTAGLAEEKPREDVSSASERVRFRKAPTPVTSRGTTAGHVALEADVNTEGKVIAVRLLENTTGSTALAEKNRAALQNAEFYPLSAGGRVRPFIYNYRVSY